MAKMRPFYNLIILFTLLFFWVFITREIFSYGIGDLICCLLFVFAVTVLFFSIQQKSELRGNWTKPSNILLLGMFIVNYQYIIDIVLGYKNLGYFSTPEIVVYGCYLSTIGYLAYVLGAAHHFKLNHKLMSNSLKTSSTLKTISTIKFTYLVTLQILCFALWLYSVNVIALLSGSLYGAEVGPSHTANLLETLLFGTNIAILVCVVINSQKNHVKTFKSFLQHNSAISWACIITYMIIRLVSGDRGPFIYTGLALYFSYIFVTKKKLKIVTILLFFISFSLLISLVGMARSDAESGTFIERMSNSYSEFSSSETARFSNRTILNSTEELALSVRCNLLAIDEVRNHSHPLKYGQYQIYQLLECIPFMPSFLTNTLNIEPKDISSGSFLTKVHFGDYYSSGQIGTTCIADFYLDGGIIGVFVGMFLVGLFFRYVDRVICIYNSVSVIALIITIIYASMCIYISRSSFISQLKPFVIVVILFYANLFISNQKWQRV